MTYTIVCDSSCDLRNTVLQPDWLRLETVPLRIDVNGQEFLDNEDLNIPLLLNEMAESKSGSSTACPSPAAFARAFENADCSICITISSNLSGTYNAAVLARDMVLEEHPEKKICVIDSKSTAGAIVLIAKRAQALLEASDDPDFESVCSELRLYQASLRTVFTLENYDNLIKNGRMRPLVGTLLHSLGIHIIAEATSAGQIHVCGKAKGEARTYKSMVDYMRQSKDCTNANVFIAHCENLAGALKLKQQILAELPVKAVNLLACRGLTSFYAMQNGLIVAY